MPKIITREYDNTKAGEREYSNFAVVIPGKVSDNYNAEAFDENGVYVCSTQKDFINNVGVVGTPEVVTEGECATVDGGALGQVSEVNWGVYGPDGLNELYTATEITDEEKQVAGKLICKIDTKWYSLKLAKEFNAAAANYARVQAGKEGRDAKTSYLLRGNQYAYDVLGLGFQVVYVKIDNETDMEADGFFDFLKDRSNYDFRYITTGGYESTAAYKVICNLATFDNKKDDIYTVNSATGRGDCIALVDIIEDDALRAKKTQSKIIAEIITRANAMEYTDKYSAIFAPHVHYNRAADAYGKNSEYKVDVMYPGSFNYLACSSKVLNSNNEWYAVAGYYRGVSPLAIDGTSLMLGEIAINALEPRNGTVSGLKHSVNVLTRIRGQYYLWGNRTAHLFEKDDLVASNFLNIRHICTTIKKEAYIVCKKLTFEPNSDLLWNSFCNAMTPTLEKMYGDQGISAYKFVKIRDTRKALIRAKIKIVPIEAVEDFDISLYLEDSVDGVTVNFEDN